MIKLKSDLEQPPRKRGRRLLLLLLLLVGVAVSAAVSERWRGQWCLKTWKNAQAARGESFDAKAVWPTPSVQSREFSNALTHATAKPLGRLGRYTSEITGIVPDASGQWKRGSQEALPSIPLSGSVTNSWQDLGELLNQSETTLQSLRTLMKNPPEAMGYNAEQSLANDHFPNFVGVRVSAQILHAAVINDLHNGHLGAAQQNLEALFAFAKLYEKDPTLVNYMIRIAILGLSFDASWDALQAEGWTESRVASILQACPDSERLLSQMPRCLEAERISRIYMYHFLRSNSYDTWLRRYEPLTASFGVQAPADAAPIIRFERQWFFHPLWSFAWADQEELIYLRRAQTEITALREASKQHSWLRLKQQIATNRDAYRAPAASCRFYETLPMVDRLGTPPNKEEHSESADPYPDFSRAWAISMKNLTLMEMMKSAIALKLYKLKHGKSPAGLIDLVPEFLAAVPIDLMDGQPLRYRPNPDDSFTLYSVGDDGKDDGGQFQNTTVSKAKPNPAPWTGKDWVWQHCAPNSGKSQISSTALGTYRE